MNISRFARCLSLFTLLLGAPLAQAAQDSAIPSPRCQWQGIGGK
jgi:hypothetical protein